ncbi:succinylglutamate desuccinylase [Halomonas sp. Bachu 37]|uniref:succinylglutamate desuccinylase n=1 Tax=Halomonas kashgarensis TaxID=3084920 RepID=UPI0032166061
MLSEWLDATLEGREPTSLQGELPSGRYRFYGPGIVELLPDTIGPQGRACVFSAAIHGNETAPVELVGELLAGVEAGTLRLGAPLLVILGNLPALRQSCRFISTNLNRLFRRELDATGEEADRARELMAAVDAFYARHASLGRLHYDLHTAIRDSRYPRFVVEPYAETAIAHEQWRWLAAAGIQAALHQHQHSWTFSHYTKHYHAAQSFTLELGKVAPFGANDLAALQPMLALLQALAEGREPTSAPLSEMQFFRVEYELMRSSEAFTLCIADDTPNFTEFPPGACLARDAVQGDFIVGETPLRVVFPNPKVELGARAALLVAPSSVPDN